MQKAIELVTKAVEYDEKHDYKEAYYLYCSSLQYFVPLITEEADATKRLALRSRALSYMKRAEEIKTGLIEEEYKKAVSSETTALKETSPSSANSSNIVDILEPDLRYKQLCKSDNFHICIYMYIYICVYMYIYVYSPL